MANTKKIVIEVAYRADCCPSSVYMDQAVKDVLGQYADDIVYQRVDLMRDDGKARFLELSCALFGEEAVKKYCRVAPVPSLFIDGELSFGAIPPRFELEGAIEAAILQKKPTTD
jgi:hypothetical protein